jgi:hypothetical protein
VYLIAKKQDRLTRKDMVKAARKGTGWEASSWAVPAARAGPSSMAEATMRTTAVGPPALREWSEVDDQVSSNEWVIQMSSDE